MPKIKRFQMIAVPSMTVAGAQQITLIIAGLGEDNKMYKWENDKWINLK